MTPTDNFISHLIELRDRLLRVVLGFIIVFIGFFPFANKIYALLAAPLLSKLPAGGQMIATAVTTPFFVPMKVAMMAAFIVSLPHTMYQVWAFIAPGLYSHEKKFMIPMIIASSLLFLAGMAFAYFAVFPVVFGFIVGSAPIGVAVMTDIGNYLDFVLTLFFAFGLAFQVPIAVVMTVRFGWLTIAQLKEARGYVVVGAFIIGAIFTPPDIISQFMLAVPIWLLFELGLIVASFTKQTPTQNIQPPISKGETQ
ncbi:MAG: twin-arginine translocase subunit TatC [Methylotenera sp.]|uniref:twin-arginine translocase subunit TatC n=1 Tax=Methylotenera sp. TaxID=2051956 RepID=UPI0024885EB9|nr:twin-arginine translocase subunit TatC [Methylotenera sp.]MDI1309144.1 twin-arginine translocase subunit TatC [Methylotenera sp.]